MYRHPPASRARRRWRRGLSSVVVVAALTGCGSTTPTGTAPASGAGPAVTALDTKTAPGPPFAVGVRQVTIADADHTLSPPHAAVTGPAMLATFVYYPALGAPGGGPQSDAPAARAPRAFPAVVFGHGYEYPPSFYAPLLARWASAGFVVVAPTFPLAVTTAPGGPDEADIVNQPYDLRAAVDWVVRAAADPANFLHGRLDPSRLAVAGQSDGGEAAAALAYASCCRDRRISAALILSAKELPGEGGYFADGGPPLLVVQGTADTINPPAGSEQLYDSAPVAKDMLLLEGAGHLPPYAGGEPYFGVVAAVTVDFLRAQLYGDEAAGRRMPLDGNKAGLATLAAQPRGR